MGSMKNGVNIRVARFGCMAVKRFSPTNATIRLPLPSTEAPSNTIVVNPPLVITPRVDSPETPLSLDDTPDYQESKTLLQDWERKMSEEHSSESQDTSQSLGIEGDSQPSPENRNDIVPCDVPGSIMKSVTEPDAVAKRMLQSPPHFSDVSDISPLSSEESFIPSDPHGNSPVLSPDDTSRKEQLQEQIMVPQEYHCNWLKPS